MEKKDKNTPVKKTLNTKDGNIINYNETGVDFWNPTLQELEEDKQIFLNKCLEAGKKLLQDVFKEDFPDTYTPETLDELIEKWNDGKSKELNMPEQTFINILGALFGQYVNMEFNGRWLLITDEYGTDYACKTNVRNFEFQFFPFSTVKNAVQDHMEGKLSGIIALVRNKLNEA